MAEKALTAVIRRPISRASPRAQSAGHGWYLDSQDSRLCEEIDEKVHAFLDRPIEGDWPYLWIDAT
jgi:putative transposase